MPVPLSLSDVMVEEKEGVDVIGQGFLAEIWRFWELFALHYNLFFYNTCSDSRQAPPVECHST